MRVRPPVWLAVTLIFGACSPRVPHVVVGAVGGDLDRFLVGHLVSGTEALRSDEVGRSNTSSYHVVQVRSRERPHRHVNHDLTVAILRGTGWLQLGDTRLDLGAGDVVAIPRGTVHWFVNTGSGLAVALAMFSPPVDGADFEPVDVDSRPGSR